MKKIIVNGACAAFIGIALSSFTVNTNNVGNAGFAPYQDTTHKKMHKDKMEKTDKMDQKKWDKSKMDSTGRKMKKDTKKSTTTPATTTP